MESRWIEQQLEDIRASSPLPDAAEAAEWLPQATERIRAWAQEADGDDLKLLLQATQAEVHATRDTVEIRGFVPQLPGDDADSLVTIERTSA
jgi:hypothetical protein